MTLHRSLPLHPPCERPEKLLQLQLHRWKLHEKKWRHKTARVLSPQRQSCDFFTQGWRDVYHVMRFHVRCLKMTSPWLPSNWIASASVSGGKGWPLKNASCFASTSNWILRITLVVFAKDVFGIFLICFGHIFGIALLIPKVNYIASAWVSPDGSYLERWNLRTRAGA